MLTMESWIQSKCKFIMLDYLLGYLLGYFQLINIKFLQSIQKYNKTTFGQKNFHGIKWMKKLGEFSNVSESTSFFIESSL